MDMNQESSYSYHTAQSSLDSNSAIILATGQPGEINASTPPRKRPGDTQSIVLVEAPAKKCMHKCHKCRIAGCREGNKSANCQNPCADCNQIDCPGRSSQLPDVQCGRAWSGGIKLAIGKKNQMCISV